MYFLHGWLVKCSTSMPLYPNTAHISATRIRRLRAYMHMYQPSKGNRYVDTCEMIHALAVVLAKIGQTAYWVHVKRTSRHDDIVERTMCIVR